MSSDYCCCVWSSFLSLCLVSNTVELANPSRLLLPLESQIHKSKSQKNSPHPEVSDAGEVSLGNPAIICIRDQPSSMG